MSTTSQAGPRLARNPHQASTKHYVVDARFAAILTEDFGIPAATVLHALEGEPQKAAIAICEWASRTDDPAYALRCWARRHGRGAYRTDRRDHRKSAAREQQDGTREQQDGRRRGTAPAHTDGIAPSVVRANVARMGS